MPSGKVWWTRSAALEKSVGKLSPAMTHNVKPSFQYSVNCTVANSPYRISAEQAEACVVGSPSVSAQPVDSDVDKWHYVS